MLRGFVQGFRDRQSKTDRGSRRWRRRREQESTPAEIRVDPAVGQNRYERRQGQVSPMWAANRRLRRHAFRGVMTPVTAARIGQAADRRMRRSAREADRTDY